MLAALVTTNPNDGVPLLRRPNAFIRTFIEAPLMRQQLRLASTLLVASAVLAACSDQPASAPVAPLVPRVNAALYTLPACNFTTLKSAVRNYVASSSDPIYDNIRAMQQAADQAGVYAAGMDGLARLAVVRSSAGAVPALKKSGATAAQGAAVVTGFLACMNVGQVQEGFATNIVSAMGSGGMFEVPDPTLSNAVFSKGQAAGDLFWFAKPKSTTWGALQGKRIMIFGYEISTYTGAFEDPVGGFNYNTVPMLATTPTQQTFNNSSLLLIGVCGTVNSDVRIKHKASVLLKETISDCPTNSPDIASLTTGGAVNFAASLARKGLSLFTPQPLHAAMFFVGVGGAVSELSPAIAAPISVNVAFTSQPIDGVINRPIQGTIPNVGIQVLVETTKLSKLANAKVVLSVAGNSGLNAIFYDPSPNTATADPNDVIGNTATVTRTTNANGIASFAGVSVIKAGGYEFSADANFDNLTGPTIRSVLANFQGKK